MHVYTLVWLKSDQIRFLIVELKHLDYSIDSRITCAWVRYIRLDSDSDGILKWSWVCYLYLYLYELLGELLGRQPVAQARQNGVDVGFELSAIGKLL